MTSSNSAFKKIVVMCRNFALCVDTFWVAWGYWFHMSTLQEHGSTLQASFFTYCTLSPCVDTSIPCVDSWSSFFQTLFFDHVSTPQVHVSTLSIPESNLCILSSCVDTSCPECTSKFFLTNLASSNLSFSRGLLFGYKWFSRSSI